jgi:[ribosomal protein S18]-alanine N-acetyltransferase
MHEVEARVHAAGGIGMTLHVYMGNVGAMQFYQGLGYGRVSIAKGFYGRGLDALVYRKKLP